MKLAKLQQEALAAIGQSELARFFYWTAGTALSAVYLQHRYSEDLDFFSQDLIEPALVLAKMNQVKKVLRANRLRHTVIRNRQQYELERGRESLKLEFVYFPFRPLVKPRLSALWPVKTDSLQDIAVNKIFALYERAEPKDVFDIFCIWKKQRRSIKALVKRAAKKFGVELDEPLLAARALEAADNLASIQPFFVKPTDLGKLKKGIESLFVSTGKRYLSAVLK